MIILSFVPSLMILTTLIYVVAIHIITILVALHNKVRHAVWWFGDLVHIRPALLIDSAELVVPSRLPSSVATISVLSEFRRVWALQCTCNQQMMTLQCIWNPALLEQTRRSFGELIEHSGGRLVYLKIEYSMMERKSTLHWIRHMRLPSFTKHTVFYRLVGLEDPFMFPPYPPFSKNNDIVPKITPHRAVLVLQHLIEGKLKRQYSCHVTEVLGGIAGPKNNFFEDSAVGHQLDSAYLFILLHREIQQLLRRAQEQVTFQHVETAITDIHRKAFQSNQVLALRLRVQCTGNRVRLIDLNTFLPFY